MVVRRERIPNFPSKNQISVTVGSSLLVRLVSLERKRFLTKSHFPRSRKTSVPTKIPFSRFLCSTRTSQNITVLYSFTSLSFSYIRTYPVCMIGLSRGPPVLTFLNLSLKKNLHRNLILCSYFIYMYSDTTICIY